MRIMSEGLARFVFIMLLGAAAGAQQVEVQALHPQDLLVEDHFGEGMSMHGSWLAIGAPNHASPFSEEGAVYMFERVAGSYVERAKLTHANATVGDAFGYRVLLWDDQLFSYRLHTPGNDGFRGKVYVFEHGPSGWKEAQLLEPTSGTGSQFGLGMATDGETLLIGGPTHDDGSGSDGAVWAYERGPNGWEEVQVITPSSWGFFGIDVAVDGDRAAVGTYGPAIIILHRVQGVWTEVGSIPHPQNLPGGTTGFGKIFDLSGDTLAVGVNYYGQSPEGRVIIYREVSTGNWVEETRLFASDGTNANNFGQDVRLKGNRLAVAALSAREYGIFWGATYLLERTSSGSWTEVAKLVDAPKKNRPPGWESWGDKVDFERDVVVTASLSAHNDDDVMTGGANVHLWPQGTSYCDAQDNSAGWPAFGYALGSRRVADRRFELWASKLPPNVLGFFMASRNQAQIFGAGGSSGTLCLGAPIGRFRNQIFSSGPWGWSTIDVDLGAIPMGPPIPVLPGETWSFQAWFRDGTTSNFTLPTTVTFE